MRKTEQDLLMSIGQASLHGRGRRVSKSLDRDRLKRAGLIFSSPPNEGYSRSIAGHGNMWRPTKVGWDAFYAIEKASEAEKEDAKCPPLT